jgi:hypothetical protein
MSAASSTKSVSFEDQRAPSVSSTKSIKAESVGPFGKKHYVSVGFANQNLLNPKANRVAVDVLPEWALV